MPKWPHAQRRQKGKKIEKERSKRTWTHVMLLDSQKQEQTHLIQSIQKLKSKATKQSMHVVPNSKHLTVCHLSLICFLPAGPTNNIRTFSKYWFIIWCGRDTGVRHSRLLEKQHHFITHWSATCLQVRRATFLFFSFLFGMVEEPLRTANSFHLVQSYNKETRKKIENHKGIK